MTEPERRLAEVISAQPETAARLIISLKKFLWDDTQKVENRLEEFERITGHNVDESGAV